MGTISLYTPVLQIPFCQISGPLFDFIQKRYLPPTRKSILHLGEVKTLGPHQRMTCMGSSHAFQTRLRGASKIRVMLNSVSLLWLTVDICHSFYPFFYARV